jgi:heptosyltransferase-1
VPVILGGPADADAAARIAAADPRIVNLAGQTRLPEAVAASPIGAAHRRRHRPHPHGHRAGAADGGDLRLHLPLHRHRPAHRQRDLAGLECSPCRRRPTCGGKFTCLRDITPAMVLERARAMLAAGEGA